MTSRIITISRELLLLLLLFVLLVFGRVLVFHTTHYIYLLWNIFLSIIPFIISSFLLWYVGRPNRSIILLYIGMLVWLIAFPNAPYIVTDIIHIGRGYITPILYDTMLLFTAAWVGLLFGFHSLFHIETILQKLYSKKISSIIIVVIIALSSFGMYLGRFVRFNSWDIFVKPVDFFKYILDVVINPTQYISAYLFTSLFFLFIYIAYTAWKQRT